MDHTVRNDMNEDASHKYEYVEALNFGNRTSGLAIRNSRKKRKRILCFGIGIGLTVIVISGFLVGYLVTSNTSSTPPEEPPIDLSISRPIPTVHSATSEMCEYVPDDILSMARGVDITKLDILSTNTEGVMNSPGFKRPVVKLTCKHKRLKKDSNGNVLVQLPDQVKPTGYEHVTGKGFILTNGTSRFTKAYDVKRQMGADVGLTVLQFGMFSASVSYKEKRKTLVSKHSIFSETKIAHLVKRIDFSIDHVSATVLKPHDDLAAQLAKLPDNYFRNPRDYQELIRQFGTHYFITGKFGGFIRNSTEYAEGAAETSSHFDTNGTSKTEMILRSFKASANYDKSQIESSERKDTKILIYGGDAEFGRSGNLEKWIESVEKSPKLFSGQLMPISSLVENEDKKWSLDIATRVHLGLAFLKDLDETLEILQDKRQGTNLTDIYMMRGILRDLSPDDIRNPERLDAVNRRMTALINSNPVQLLSSTNQQGFATIKIFEAEIPSSPSALINRAEYNSGMLVEIRIMKMDKPQVVLQRRKTVIYRNSKFHPKWNTEFRVPMGLDGAVKFCIGQDYRFTVIGRENEFEKMGFIRCSDLMTIQGIMEKKQNNVPIRATGLAINDTVSIILRVQIAWHPDN